MPPSEPPGSVIVVPPGSSVPGPGGTIDHLPERRKSHISERETRSENARRARDSPDWLPPQRRPRRRRRHRRTVRGAPDTLPRPFPARPQGQTPIIISADPNDITGPAGFGAGGFITPDQTLPYTIDFENIATATAPAQTVVVTQQLNPNLDLNTFQLGAIGFGSTVINVPAGRNSYSTQIDARATLGLFVDVTAGINLSTGLVTWTFTSIDPTTLDLTSNPLAGFLPPDKTPPQGEGFVSYTIEPKANLATGTVISAQATVVFDQNAPLDTPTLINTLDAGAPTSSVHPLPAATTQTSLHRLLVGHRRRRRLGHRQLRRLRLRQRRPIHAVRTDTTATSAIFTGPVGHTYGSTAWPPTTSASSSRCPPQATITESSFLHLPTTTTSAAGCTSPGPGGHE